MKPDGLEFVRDEWVKVQTCKNPDCETCPERSRFIELLTESEGMREKAEYAILPCEHFSMSECRHNWTDLDWIAAVREEIGHDER